jgi:hypothetical protein
MGCKEAIIAKKPSTGCGAAVAQLYKPENHLGLDALGELCEEAKKVY